MSDDELDVWAKETAQMIIWGLLREEGWELPGYTNDEELTTRCLIEALKKAVREFRRREP